MNGTSTPAVHPDRWVNVLHGYVTEAVEALKSGGLLIERSWLDPRDPRDATIVFSHPAATVTTKQLALVWDEVAGWRRGTFQSGKQGIRTLLSDVTYMGGGLLVGGNELAGRVLADANEPQREYRSPEDLNDGLDDALLAWN